MDRIVRTEWLGRVQVAFCSGELDLANAGALREELSELPDAHPAGVVLDLGAVQFLDLTALGVVIQLAYACQRAGVPFVLSSPRPIVLRLLRIVDLDETLLIVPTVQEAVILVETWLDVAETPARASRSWLHRWQTRQRADRPGGDPRT